PPLADSPAFDGAVRPPEDAAAPADPMAPATDGANDPASAEGSRSIRSSGALPHAAAAGGVTSADPQVNTPEEGGDGGRTVGATGDEPSPEPRPPARPRRRAVAGAAGLALLVVVAAVGAVVLLDQDDDPAEVARADAGAEASTDPTSTASTTPTIDDVTPQEAFAGSADRLVSAGSFAYAGTSSAHDVSHVRPGLWLAVDLTVEGEVDTAEGRVHEISVDSADAAVETVTDGPLVWSRQASTREALGQLAYVPVIEDTGTDPTLRGVALLPGWLEATVDRQDAAPDDLGRRVFRASLPADALGQITDDRPADDASVVLTLDAAGDPVHVEVESVPTGPPLRLDLDLSGIGEPVAIEPPGGAAEATP
ncbi:MAG TPA: hypothetical protein VE575_04645, partial [Acidimicrobiales bacterium]|nr:hypothetical protein [Acidimicrobiales bacterium]